MKGLQRLEYLKESLLDEAHNEWDNQQSLALSKKKPNRPLGTFESLEATCWLHHDHHRHSKGRYLHQQSQKDSPKNQSRSKKRMAKAHKVKGKTYKYLRICNFKVKPVLETR